jgi:hypothetical protein
MYHLIFIPFSVKSPSGWGNSFLLSHRPSQRESLNRIGSDRSSGIDFWQLYFGPGSGTLHRAMHRRNFKTPNSPRRVTVDTSLARSTPSEFTRGNAASVICRRLGHLFFLDPRVFST